MLSRRTAGTAVMVALLAGTACGGRATSDPNGADEVDPRGGAGTEAPVSRNGGSAGADGEFGGESAGTTGTSSTGEGEGGAGGAPLDSGCEYPWHVDAYGENAEPAGIVDLTACRETARGGDVLRIDRTGPDLCVPESGLAPCAGEYCTMECLTNADCAPGQVCLCAAGVEDAPNMMLVWGWGGTCMPAECESAADCGGYACGFSTWRCAPENEPGLPGFYCRTPEDECLSDADCDPPMSTCIFYPGGTSWHCTVPLTSCDSGAYE